MTDQRADGVDSGAERSWQERRDQQEYEPRNGKARQQPDHAGDCRLFGACPAIGPRRRVAGVRPRRRTRVIGNAHGHLPEGTVATRMDGLGPKRDGVDGRRPKNPAVPPLAFVESIRCTSDILSCHVLLHAILVDGKVLGIETADELRRAVGDNHVQGDEIDSASEDRWRADLGWRGDGWR